MVGKELQRVSASPCKVCYEPSDIRHGALTDAMIWIGMSTVPFHALEPVVFLLGFVFLLRHLRQLSL